MKKPGHILVIRLSALGDVAMTLPVLRRVSETYPELKFTVLTRQFFAPLFEDLPNVVSMAGKVSFREELALISNLDAMLSMDSGNGHLAANYGVPVITLWGLTHPYTGFAPFKQPSSNSLLPDLEQYPQIPTSIYGNKVPDGYYDVMRSIPAERVVEKIEEILQLNRSLPSS